MDIFTVVNGFIGLQIKKPLNSERRVSVIEFTTINVNIYSIVYSGPFTGKHEFFIKNLKRLTEVLYIFVYKLINDSQQNNDLIIKTDYSLKSSLHAL